MPKTLNDILAKVQAIDTTSLDGVEAAITQVVTDLQAVIAAAAPAEDPIATVTVTTQSGAATEFVPKV